ncbi:unnamed protein product [Cylindrotheca closterium]|uniref:Uncharacterized protein n=1 Tax=Cylindrotheca closterium TaxID=2856 RepID=A0AAD2CP04_9STRA|nr:unnamed protein product [Cylindrotheca closterium]
MERATQNNSNDENANNQDGNNQSSTASHQMSSTIVASIFAAAPRLLIELKNQFHLEPKLADLLLPFVLPVLDNNAANINHGNNATLQQFMQKRRSEISIPSLQPTLFLEGSTKWLSQFAKLSVDMLPESVRQAMPLTLVPSDISASYMATTDDNYIPNNNYYYYNIHPLAAELKLLLRFTWGRVPALTHCPDADNPFNVPYYLFWLTIQKGKSSLQGLPEVCQYIVFRLLFGATKGTVSFTEMTRTVSHILYLVQLGSLSACAQIAGPDFLQRQLQLAAQAQSSQVVQYATPLLQKLQDYQNAKLVEEGNTVVTL